MATSSPPKSVVIGPPSPKVRVQRAIGVKLRQGKILARAGLRGRARDEDHAVGVNRHRGGRFVRAAEADRGDAVVPLPKLVSCVPLLLKCSTANCPFIAAGHEDAAAARRWPRRWCSSSPCPDRSSRGHSCQTSCPGCRPRRCSGPRPLHCGRCRPTATPATTILPLALSTATAEAVALPMEKVVVTRPLVPKDVSGLPSLREFGSSM